MKKKAYEFDKILLEKLTIWKYSVISVLIDKYEHSNKYTTWKYDPYHYCMEALLERFKLFLELNDGYGDVMIESRGGKEDIRLKKSFNNLWENGTHFLKPDELHERLTSKQLKVKPKTANISGLQLADLLAHPCRRYIYKSILDKKDNKKTFSDEILKILVKDKFFKYKSKIVGYGIKKLP